MPEEIFHFLNNQENPIFVQKQEKIILGKKHQQSKNESDSKYSKNLIDKKGILLAK